jgi:hypothetical protein
MSSARKALVAIFIQTGSEGDRETSEDVHSESGVKKPQIKLKQFRERWRDGAEVRGTDSNKDQLVC